MMLASHSAMTIEMVVLMISSGLMRMPPSTTATESSASTVESRSPRMLSAATAHADTDSKRTASSLRIDAGGEADDQPGERQARGRDQQVAAARPGHVHHDQAHAQGQQREDGGAELWIRTRSSRRSGVGQPMARDVMSIRERSAAATASATPVAARIRPTWV